MKEHLDNLENELKELVPAQPSESIWQKIGDQMAEGTFPASSGNAHPSPILAHWGWLIPLSAAAIFVFIMARKPKVEDSATEPVAAVQSVLRNFVRESTRYRPIRTDHYLYDAKDEGIYILNDKTPARKMRYKFLDTYTLENAEADSSIELRIPREEVILVRLDTY